MAEKKTSKKKTVYDKKKIYQNEIAPHVVQAMRLCVKHNIPFFFQCAVANTEKETTYAGDFWLTGAGQINLADDRFERHLAVMNGFDTYWPTYRETFKAAQNMLSGIEGDMIPESYETPFTEYEGVPDLGSSGEDEDE